MRIGVICPSEIAFRRFMPALMKVPNSTFVGIGINSPNERYGDTLPEQIVVNDMITNEKEKALNFLDIYGGKIFYSYEEIIDSEEIDAIYIPLPPGLHFKWAKKALEAGKHVFVEKPATTSYEDTKSLVRLAQERGLAIHENYMFNFHLQLDEIDHIIESGELGELRLSRISFGFPLRQSNDFRYVKSLGGGALLDAGGYTIKYARRLLGDSARVMYAKLNNISGYEVDMFGSGALCNDKGDVVQIAFGMDNDYKCELEVWGSKGTLKTGRVLTAPAGYSPNYTISKNGNIEQYSFSEDDAFKKSILHFEKCILDEKEKKNTYAELLKQAELVNSFFKFAVGGYSSNELYR